MQSITFTNSYSKCKEYLFSTDRPDILKFKDISAKVRIASYLDVVGFTDEQSLCNFVLTTSTIILYIQWTINCYQLTVRILVVYIHESLCSVQCIYTIVVAAARDNCVVSGVSANSLCPESQCPGVH